ncbi:zinc finger protein 853-like [Cydia fagiglandana]|uniref:zinc finger protein 853-like n=1 Tax=Cydia fagiglandana TaxID=1458189 RepID=UPI002FEDFD50
MKYHTNPEFLDTGEFMMKRSLLSKSKRAIIVRSPAGTTEYRCVECPMGFNDKAGMEQHLAVHNQEYRFLCGICGTALKRKEHLDRHTLEHKEVRPHICPDCGKGFKRKEHLNIHRTIHSGEKNHICPLCDKSFYRKDHLQKHLQTHNKMFIEQNIYPVSDQELLGIKQEVTDEEQDAVMTEPTENIYPVSDQELLGMKQEVTDEEQADDVMTEPTENIYPVSDQELLGMKQEVTDEEQNIYPVSDQELLGMKQEVTDEEQADDVMTEPAENIYPVSDQELLGRKQEVTDEEQADDVMTEPTENIYPVSDQELLGMKQEVTDEEQADDVMTEPAENIYPVSDQELLGIKQEVIDEEQADDVMTEPTETIYPVSDQELLGIKQEVTHEEQDAVMTEYPVSDQELLGIKQEVTDEEQDAVMTEISDAGLGQPADPERPHICPICHKGFKRRDHLKLHSVSHLARDKLCPHCGKAFRTDDQVNNHMITHVKLDSPASEEPCLMEDEDVQQEEDSLLIPRVSMQEGERTYYSATEERPYSCALCGRRFKRKQHLKVHANVHARNQPPTIWCSICSEGFFNNSQFESHECMGADPDETPTNQENSYPTHDNVEIMNVPIVTEEPEPSGLPVPRRVFVCKFCAKPFKRKDHYRIHLHVHTGVKSFFCEDCGKGFYRKDHLQKHSQVHTRTRPPPPRRPRKEMPELYPIHMFKTPDTRASVKPEITITAPSNTKLRVPLQIKVPYQVVTSLDNGEQRVTTVDPRDLLS